MPAPIFSSATVSLQICSWTFCVLHWLMMAVIHSAILKLCYIFWVLSPPVGSFTDSFLAHYSVHIRFHWVLKPHWKDILLPLLFFSSIELHSTTTESVLFSKIHSWVTSLQGIRPRATSREIITLYWDSPLPSGNQPAVFGQIMHITSISQRMSSFLGGCSVPQTNRLLVPKRQG